MLSWARINDATFRCLFYWPKCYEICPKNIRQTKIHTSELNLRGLLDYKQVLKESVEIENVSLKQLFSLF